jgi:hypothetical protein
MHDSTIGQELVLTAQDTLKPQRSKPTLIQLGNRMVSSDGRFHSLLAADYLLSNGRHEWVKVADLSRMFCGANTIDGKRRIRKNMSHVFMHLLNQGEFLVYETATNGRINAVKILDMKSDQERQSAGPQLERMKRSHQLTNAKYEKALKVIELQAIVTASSASSTGGV